MNITTDQSSNNLIEPSRNRNRQTSAIVVIVVVILGLLVSIFTQPFGDFSGRNTNNQSYQNQGGATDPTRNDDQNSGSENDITKVLLWTGQIVISFIALLASVSELAGINIRELFVSRSSKTSVEEFPFLAIKDFDRLVDYLFPDPKKPLLPDRSINYIPQISSITDAVFQQSGFMLIRGRSKTGKTREAIELLKRWWYTGPTVLVARTHVDFFPPFKIPENLPTRNIILLFDDLDRYFDGSDAVKRFDATIQFFQNLCHNREELKIIATVREEDEFWHKLRFDKGSSPWDKFELIQLEPLHNENTEKLIIELAEASGIEITSIQANILANKNDGTFLNLVLTFRGWVNQSINKMTDDVIREFEGVLLKTWRRRYEQLVQISSVNKPIYASIDFMQTYGIPLVPSTIKEIATEFLLGKTSLSFLGLFDRLRNWGELTPLLNWYRDPVRKRKSFLVFTLIGIVLAYSFLYILLCLLPGNTQTRIYDEISGNISIILALLFPLWILILFFILYACAGILHFFAFRKVSNGLDKLTATEIPLRDSHLRPYEGQFEGNGSSNNWNVEYYSTSNSDKKFHKQIGQRLTNQYLSWAEQFRLEGEYPAARNLARLAMKLSPEHPAPSFLLGKIELEEGNYQEAIRLYSTSRNLYGTSSTVAYATQQLALAYLYLDQYKPAEEAADKALTYMPSLRLARWILGIAKVKSGKLSEGVKQCQSASKRQAIPLEIKKIASTKGFMLEEWFTNIKDYKPSQRKKNNSIVGRLWSKTAPLAISIIIIPLILFCSMASVFSFSRSDISIKIFPQSPSLHALHGDVLYDQSRYLDNAYRRDELLQDAMDSYNKAIRIDPQYSYAYIRRGLAQDDLEDYNTAILYDPNYAYAYFMRGNYYNILYSETVNFSKAIEDYSKAIQIDPNYDEAYAQRGSAYEQLGEIDNAIMDYESATRLNSDPPCNTILCWTTAISLDPNNANYYRRRGYLYEGSYPPEYEKAIADYTESLKLDPKNITLYYSRGDAYYKTRNYETAMADYLIALSVKPDTWLQCLHQDLSNAVCLSAAIQLDPDLADAYAYRGDVFNQNGKLELAIADYSDAIRLNSQYKIHAHIARSQIYEEFGEYEKAIEDYTEIIENDPGLSLLYYFTRGDTYYKLGKKEQATADYLQGLRNDPSAIYFCGNIDCWSVAVQYSPNDINVRNERAQSYIDANKFQEAVTDYTYILNFDPKNFAAFIGRGYAYSELGQKQQAIADFTEAIRIEPESDLAYNNRGFTHYELGDNNKALEDFLVALRINPSGISWMCDNLPCWDAAVQSYSSSASNFAGRGNAYFQLGDYEKAVVDYEKAIQINPDETYKVCDNIYCWNAAIDLFPNSPMPYIKRGEINVRLGTYDGAIIDFSQAIQLNPNDYSVFMQLGDVYNTLGDTENAILNYTEAVRKGLTSCTTELCWTTIIQFYPNSRLGYIGRGDFYRNSVNYEKAIIDYQKAIQIEPSNTRLYSLYSYLADMYTSIGEYESAIEYYTKTLPAPDTQLPCVARIYVQSYISRGDLFKKLGKENDANSDYTRAINEHTRQINCTYADIASTRYYHQFNQSAFNDTDFHVDVYMAELFTERSFAYKKIGENDRALSDITNAIDYYVHSSRFNSENAPEYIGNGYLRRCSLYYQLGKYKEAVDDCTKSIIFTPNSPAAYNQRGLAYQALGKQMEADLDFQKYNELIHQQQ